MYLNTRNNEVGSLLHCVSHLNTRINGVDSVKHDFLHVNTRIKGVGSLMPETHLLDQSSFFMLSSAHEPWVSILWCKQKFSQLNPYSYEDFCLHQRMMTQGSWALESIKKDDWSSKCVSGIKHHVSHLNTRIKGVDSVLHHVLHINTCIKGQHYLKHHFCALTHALSELKL